MVRITADLCHLFHFTIVRIYLMNPKVIARDKLLTHNHRFHANDRASLKLQMKTKSDITSYNYMVWFILYRMHM